MNDGHLEIELNVFGAELIKFRMTVDDFHTKWVLIGLATITTLALVAQDVKELLP